MKKLIFLIFAVFVIIFSCSKSDATDNLPMDGNVGVYKNRTIINNLTGTKGTYALPPLTATNHVNVPQLIKELKQLNANSYNWLIWKTGKEWEDLKVFLPVAAAENIKVWITIVPPSESEPVMEFSSQPYRMDYKRWATEIAKLSVEHPNLVAWSIDDFAVNNNLSTFTPSYMKLLKDVTKKINPDLAFIPCIYYADVSEDFAKRYGNYFDGILFPFFAQSTDSNLHDVTPLYAEINKFKKTFKDSIPIIVDVYSHTVGFADHEITTPQYVKAMITESRKYADGVKVYCHQDSLLDPDKFNAIKTGFE